MEILACFGITLFCAFVLYVVCADRAYREAVWAEEAVNYWRAMHLELSLIHPRYVQLQREAHKRLDVARRACFLPSQRKWARERFKCLDVILSPTGQEMLANCVGRQYGDCD